MGLLRPRYLALALLALFVGLAVVVFFYGGPQAPAPSAGTAAADRAPSSDATEADAPTSAGDEDTRDGGPLPFEEVSGPAPEGGVVMPLIPIPGCKCHSDDPAVVEEHSRYRLSECRECH